MNAFFKKRRDWLWIILAFLGMRLAFSALGWVLFAHPEQALPWEGHVIFETRALTVPDWGENARRLIDGWYRWDTGWYLKIAALGYAPDDGTIIFPPLFPLLIRWTAPLFGQHYLLAGLFLANLSALATLLLFFESALQAGLDRSQAWLALLLFLTFPSTFFLFVAYSEAPFFALLLAAWWSARRGKWGWAGLFGALATLTRTQGWTLSLALGYLVLAGDLGLQPVNRQILDVLRLPFSTEGRKVLFGRLHPVRLVSAAAPILALLGYSTWLNIKHLGNMPDAFRNYWALEVVMPWQGLWATLLRFSAGALSLVDWIDLAMILLAFFLAAIGLRRIPVALSLYVWASLGLIFMRDYEVHLFAGFVRYALSLFPLFWLVPQLKWGCSLARVFMPVFLLLQLFLLWLFMNWYWVA